MAVVQLASESDVEDVLGRALTSSESGRVDAILDKASELFRRRSGQQFAAGRSTVRLKVNGGRVYLSQRPVNSITSIVDGSGDAVDYDLFDQWLQVPLLSHQFVTVTYTHGGAVPDLVRLAVAEIAKKVLLINPNAAAGLTQHTETSGPFTQSDTYATWAQGGQTMLAPADDALAQSYNFRPPRVIVTSS